MRFGSKWIFALSLVALVANAESAVKIGKVELNGNGCPAAGATAQLNEETGAIELTFGAFQAEAAGQGGSSIARRTCGISIPFEVSEGFRVSSPLIDTKINVRAKDGATVKLQFEAFFAGSTGPKVEKVYSASASYRVSNRVPKEQIAWSDCGKGGNARLNMSVLINNPSATPASAKIDGAKILPLRREPCGS